MDADLHLITDDRVVTASGFPGRAAEALAAGGSRVALHLRAPGSPGRRIYELAGELRAPARRSGSIFLVSDRVDVALAVGLDGVNLPEHGLPTAVARSLLEPDARGTGGTRGTHRTWVGASVHGPEAAVRARDGGADFLVVGTVFATTSHPEREPAGPQVVRDVASAVDLPLLAIGGVTPDRVAEAVDGGAHGVAVRSGVWASPDVAAAVRGYLSALDASRAGEPR